MMKPKNYLLPYCCQKVGWGCLIATLILFIASLIIFNELKWIEQEYSRISSAILYLLFILGVFFLALSKEKVKDEMIRELRVSSIAITFYISITIATIFSLLFCLDHALRFINHPVVRILSNTLTNVVTFFFIYIAIYKIRLWKGRFISKKEGNND